MRPGPVRDRTLLLVYVRWRRGLLSFCLFGCELLAVGGQNQGGGEVQGERAHHVAAVMAEWGELSLP